MSSERRRVCGTSAAALVVLVAAAVMAACSTTSGDRASGSRRPAANGEEASPARADPARRRGGFYLDDGPGERDLADLTALAAQPEPMPFAEPLHPRANQPYRVLGNDYRPMTRREPFRQRGTASWYGRKFHGQPTAIGERYDMYGLTGAHPTLPIPSFVRVTHLGNGRSVVVRVNDRGPFLHGRAIDLSYLAAFKLGFADQGSAEVEVELLDPSGTKGIYAASTSGLVPGLVPRAMTPAASTTSVTSTTLEVTPAGPAPEVVMSAGVMPAGVMPEVVTQVVVTPVSITAVEATPAPAIRPAAAAIAAPKDTAAEVAPAAVTASAASPSSVTPSPVKPAPAPLHFLQLGAFRARTNAEAASTQLRRQLSWLQVPIEVEPHGSMFRVQAGPYPVRELAAQAGSEVESRTGLRPLLLPRLPD